MNNHRYLITGGAGFIGSHFVKHLLKQGIPLENISILDKMTYASDRRRLEGLKLRIIEADITNGLHIRDALREYKITCVVNFAAETHVDNSILNQDAFVQTNIVGVQKILEETRDYWSDFKTKLDVSPLLIHLSTDEVYGSSQFLRNEKFTEASPLNPKNPYAATKAAADMMIGAYINTYKYPAIIIRSTNNYGSGQHKEKLIPKVLEAIHTNKDIPLYGDGQQKRTWLNVEDNCEAILKIIKSGRLGDIYNVVGPSSLSNKELVVSLINNYEASSRSTYTGQIRYVEDRPGHDVFYNISDHKIKSELDFKPSIILEEGLINLIKQTYKCEVFLN